MRVFAVSLVFLAGCGAVAPAPCAMPDASDDASVDAALDAAADSANAPLVCPERGKPCKPPGAVVCVDLSSAFVCECFASGCAWSMRAGINCSAPFCSR